MHISSRVALANRKRQELLSPDGRFYLVAVKQNNVPNIQRRMYEKYNLRSDVRLPLFCIVTSSAHEATPLRLSYSAVQGVNIFLLCGSRDRGDPQNHHLTYNSFRNIQIHESINYHFCMTLWLLSRLSFVLIPLVRHSVQLEVFIRRNWPFGLRGDAHSVS